jgi:hydrogenase maturation factor
MKKTLAITIDFELVEKLRKEDNYSALINKLLNDYYAMKALDEEGANLTHEQLKKMLKLAEKKQELENQIKDLETEYDAEFRMAKG